MEKEIKHKGKVITKKTPSGMFEYYSDKQKRFLKFDTIELAKSSIDKEGKKDIKESVKTKKITLAELKSLVKNIVKEEQSKKSVIKENKISPQINDKITKIAQEKYKKNNGKTKEDFDRVYDETIKEFGYDPKIFKSYMEKYFTPFEDGDYMEESVKEKKKRVIKENKEDLIDFIVPQYYASALINGDFSGLESDDEQKLNSFIDNVQRKFGNANFMLGDEDDMDLGFMSRSDVDNLGADMMRVYVNPSNPMQESVKPKTKKIKLSEVRQLVRKMIKEESMNPKSFGVGSFGVTKDVDLGEKPFEDLDSSLKNTDNLLKRVSKLCDKFSISYSGGDGDFEKKVVMQIMRKVRNDINKVSDKLIEDVIFYMEDRYDF